MLKKGDIMMKNMISAAILLMILQAVVYAANYDNPIEGKLKAVYSDFITITVPATVTKSPDTNASDTGDLDIKVNAGTVYDNFTQLSDLKQGDTISVTYHEEGKGGKTTAERIVRTQLAAQPAASSVTTTQTTVTTTTVTNREGNDYDQ